MGVKKASPLPLPDSLLLGRRKVDRRRVAVRRYEEIAGQLAQELGGKPTVLEWITIQRAAGLVVQIEQIEKQLVAGGKPVSTARLAALNSSLSRYLERLADRGRPARGRAAKAADEDEGDAHALAVLRATEGSR